MKPLRIPKLRRSGLRTVFSKVRQKGQGLVSAETRKTQKEKRTAVREAKKRSTAYLEKARRKGKIIPLEMADFTARQEGLERGMAVLRFKGKNIEVPLKKGNGLLQGVFTMPGDSLLVFRFNWGWMEFYKMAPWQEIFIGQLSRNLAFRKINEPEMEKSPRKMHIMSTAFQLMEKHYAVTKGNRAVEVSLRTKRVDVAKMLQSLGWKTKQKFKIDAKNPEELKEWFFFSKTLRGNTEDDLEKYHKIAVLCRDGTIKYWRIPIGVSKRH